MNKTVIINIAGSIFHIEEDAYSIIKNYDSEIRNRFNNSPDGFEIVSDIENRIAELLSEKLNIDNRKVIVKQDVEEVINRLGRVSDFEADSETGAQDDASLNNDDVNRADTKKRKLFRNTGNKMLGGVCAGIADYFGIDATWVRLAWVLLLITYGMGIIIYLILWAVLPESENEDSSEPLNRRQDADDSQRKLFRDTHNRKIGGVCAGLGVYFGVSVTLIRLIFVALLLFPILLFLRFFPFIFAGFPVMIFYIILMIVIPEPKTEDEIETMNRRRETDKPRRELFRNPDNKQIGGVCSGLGVYLGASATLIRLIFVALALFSFLFFKAYGIGFFPFIFAGFPVTIFYIILMIVIPEAKTVADKMAMKGEPDNLDGIVRNAENKAREGGTKTNTPNVEVNGCFHSVFSSLSEVLTFILKFFVKICGLFLVLTATCILIALVVLGIMFMTNNITGITDDGFTNVYRVISDTYKVLFTVTSLIALLIPTFWLIWLGMRMITDIKPMNRTVVLSVWGIWILAVAGASYTLVETAMDFKTEALTEELVPLQLPHDGILYLSGTSNWGAVHRSETFERGYGTVTRREFLRNRNWMSDVYLLIEKSPDSGARIVQKMRSYGRTDDEALDNLESIIYSVEVRDSLLSFDRTFRLKDDALWRNQRVHLVLQLPVNAIIKVNATACKLSYQLDFWNCRDNENSSHAAWQMTENGLKCLSQVREQEQRKQTQPDDSVSKPSIFSQSDMDSFIARFKSENDIAKVDYSMAGDSEQNKGGIIRIVLHANVPRSEQEARRLTEKCARTLESEFADVKKYATISVTLISVRKENDAESEQIYRYSFKTIEN
jgi:phage shock protein PspC (stress-responsive transcriptional regulator)